MQILIYSSRRLSRFFTIPEVWGDIDIQLRPISISTPRYNPKSFASKTTRSVDFVVILNDFDPFCSDDFWIFSRVFMFFFTVVWLKLLLVVQKSQGQPPGMVKSTGGFLKPCRRPPRVPDHHTGGVDKFFSSVWIRGRQVGGPS